MRPPPRAGRRPRERPEFGPVTGDIDAAAVKVALGQAEAAVAHPRDREREDAPDRFTEAVADDFVLPPNRIGVAAATRQSLTMTGRGLLKIKHNPQQLFDVIVLPIVFTVMFSTIFGGAIAGDVTSYLPLLIPGLLVQVTVAASVITGCSCGRTSTKGCSTDSNRCRSPGSPRSPAHCWPTPCGMWWPRPSPSASASPWATGPAARSA